MERETRKKWRCDKIWPFHGVTVLQWKERECLTDLQKPVRAACFHEREETGVMSSLRQ